VTSYTVTGLSPSAVYYFVVRAKDEKGNTDANRVEGSATTLTPPDITAPSFDGLVSTTAVSETRIDLSWRAATDEVTASSNIVYLIYLATTSGGQSFATPTFTTAAGATSYSVTGLNPGASYFFVVRARDEAGNVDTNTVEQSATLHFTDLSISNVSSGDGYLSFDVQNSGDLAADNVEVFILYEDFYNNQFCESQVVSVPAEESVAVPSIFIGSAISYKIIVDPNNVLPSESDRTNNINCYNSTDNLCLSPTPTSCE
jgi:hypothetical protein